MTSRGTLPVPHASFISAHRRFFLKSVCCSLLTFLLMSLRASPMVCFSASALGNLDSTGGGIQLTPKSEVSLCPQVSKGSHATQRESQGPFHALRGCPPSFPTPALSSPVVSDPPPVTPRSTLLHLQSASTPMMLYLPSCSTPHYKLKHSPGREGKAQEVSKGLHVWEVELKDLCCIEVSPEKETEQLSCRDSLNPSAACRLCRELKVTALMGYLPSWAGFSMMLLFLCTIPPPVTPDP